MNVRAREEEEEKINAKSYFLLLSHNFASTEFRNV